MSDSTLVFASADGRNEIVVNFGLFSGRDATAAEVDRLGHTLLERVEAVEIVCEQRYELDREHEASVYVIRVVLPSEQAGLRDSLLPATEAWAQECIAERRYISL